MFSKVFSSIYQQLTLDVLVRYCRAGYETGVIIQVDIWSGNHPFYLGTGGTIVEDDGRVEKFRKKFQGLDMLSSIVDENTPKEQGEE